MLDVTIGLAAISFLETEIMPALQATSDEYSITISWQVGDTYIIAKGIQNADEAYRNLDSNRLGVTIGGEAEEARRSLIENLKNALEGTEILVLDVSDVFEDYGDEVEGGEDKEG